MDTCYTGWTNYKKIDVQASIFGGYYILYFCFYSLLEEKAKSENLSMDGMY